MISSTQLWPAGPRNAKVAWKKCQTPKAKAAPRSAGDDGTAMPKKKAWKKQEFILM
jgi:hypothetical protein